MFVYISIPFIFFWRQIPEPSSTHRKKHKSIANKYFRILLRAQLYQSLLFWELWGWDGILDKEGLGSSQSV